MIKVELEEGYVFDLISILEVKTKLLETAQKRLAASESFVELCKDVSKQIGAAKFANVLESEEYKDLTAANTNTFLLVDKARAKKSGLAKKTDSANIDRYNAKVALQKKFFNTPCKEQKSSK